MGSDVERSGAQSCRGDLARHLREEIAGNADLQQDDSLLFLGQLRGHGSDELVADLAVDCVPRYPA